MANGRLPLVPFFASLVKLQGALFCKKEIVDPFNSTGFAEEHGI
jgi:hypothetical protein